MRQHLAIIPALIAICATCQAQHTARPIVGGDGLDIVMARRAAMQRGPEIISRDITTDTVTTHYADGTVTQLPRRRLLQPKPVRDAVEVALAKDRLYDAALDLAQLDADAPLIDKLAATDALTHEARNSGTLAAAIGAALGLAAGAAGGAALGKGKGKSPP